MNYVDPSGLVAVLLRNKVKNAGGTIEWDPVKRTATAIIAGQEVVYKPDNDDRINIDAKGRIVIDDFCLDNDFSSVVGHLWGDRRLGLSKLDVYSMRRSSRNSLKQIPKALVKTAGELKAICNDPDFQQGVKNTGYAVINTHSGFILEFAFNTIVPSSGDPEFDEAMRKVDLITWTSPSKILDIKDLFTKNKKLLKGR